MDTEQSDVINTIDNIDQMCIEDNGYIDVDWFNEVNLSAVQLQNEIFCEGFSNADIFHEDDQYSTAANTFSNDDDTLFINNVSNRLVDEINFYATPWAQIDLGANGRICIDQINQQINQKSSIERAFNKSTRAKLKGSYITLIEGDPVFSTRDAKLKL